MMILDNEKIIADMIKNTPLRIIDIVNIGFNLKEHELKCATLRCLGQAYKEIKSMSALS